MKETFIIIFWYEEELYIGDADDALPRGGLIVQMARKR